MLPFLLQLRGRGSSNISNRTMTGRGATTVVIRGAATRRGRGRGANTRAAAALIPGGSNGDRDDGGDGGGDSDTNNRPLGRPLRHRPVRPEFYFCVP